jgi:hypothetical protein
LQDITILPYPGVYLAAASGTASPPFVVTNGHISQPIQTTLATSGRAVYQFTIANAGTYTIQATVNAPDDGANSFFLNLDAEPQDPTMIWDIPLTSGFELRTVSWRGNGTDTANQFVPQIFTLSAGSHQLILRGREANALLQDLTLVPYP